MLDMKVLRNEPEKVKRAFLKRKENFDLDGLFELDDLRKQLIFENEQKKAQQNTVSKQIPMLKKEGRDTTEVFAEMKKLSEEIENVRNRMSKTPQENEAFIMDIIKKTKQNCFGLKT